MIAGGLSVHIQMKAVVGLFIKERECSFSLVGERGKNLYYLGSVII